MSTLRNRVTVPIAIALALVITPALSGCFGNPIESLIEGATGGDVDLGGMSPDDQDAVYGNIAIPRVGQPEEVAKLALFLASDEASYSTGCEFTIDGGMLAGTVNPYARVEPN